MPELGELEFCRVCGEPMPRNFSKVGYGDAECTREDNPEHQLKEFELRLREEDFTPGDTFWIGEFAFEVIAVNES